MRRTLAKAPILLAAFGFLFWLVLGVEWFRGVRKITVLRDAGEPVFEAYPSLAVIIPARDEERAVSESVRSVLAQDYPGPLEVVAVDDRSADRTGEALESLRAEHPSLLRVLHVAELPEGWLGKTHALALGPRRRVGTGCSSPTQTFVSHPTVRAGPWVTPSNTIWTTSRSRPRSSLGEYCSGASWPPSS